MFRPLQLSLPAILLAVSCLHGCNEASPLDDLAGEPPFVSEGPVYMPRPEDSGLEHPDDITLDARTPYVPPRQNEPDAMDEDPLLEEVDAAPLMLIDMDVPDENLDPDPDPEPRPEEEPEWEAPDDPGPLFCNHQGDVGSACRWMADCFASRGCPTAAHEAGHQSVENHCRFRFRPDEIALLCGSRLACDQFAGITPLCHRL